jgi:hypothetical protein
MTCFASRYTIVAVLGLTLVGCTRHTSIPENVNEQLRSGATRVNIGQTGDLAWDDMFVFGPYSPKDGTCKTLRLNGSECSAAGIRDVDEGEFLLVFLQRGRVSKIESFPRTVGNFDDNCLAKDIARSAAVFTVERRPAVYLMCR